MISTKLRALGTALFLGTAVVAAGAIGFSAPAEAAARPQVGKALQEAIHDAQAGNVSAANEKVHEAESVGGLTPGDQQAIEQTKQYIAAKSGGAGARGKFLTDYANNRFREAIQDAEEMRKSGSLDAQDQQVLGQAYYQLGDYAAAISELRDLHNAAALGIVLDSALKSGDIAAARAAEEELVVSYNQPKYWVYLLSAADSTPGMSADNTMDVYRIRLLTGSMRNQDDYMTASEVAIQVNCPTEAASILQKGIDAKVVVADPGRTARLMNLAKTQAAAEVAGLPKAAQAAGAAKTGDADIKLSSEYWGMGQYQQALDAAKAGIAKGTSDDALAQIRLGMAYMGLHQKDSAVRAFSQASKGKPADAAVAHLWSDYAKTH